MNVKLIQVIEAEERAGSGVPDDPVRFVRRYYATYGILLAERDTWLEQEYRKRVRSTEAVDVDRA